MLKSETRNKQTYYHFETDETSICDVFNTVVKNIKDDKWKVVLSVSSHRHVNNNAGQLSYQGFVVRIASCYFIVKRFQIQVFRWVILVNIE